MNFINEINDILWTYILIIMLLGVPFGSASERGSYSSVCFAK